MKKDVFNGKIADAFIGMVKFTLIMVPLVCLFCCGVILSIAVFYDNIEPAARIFSYIIGGISGLYGIPYPFVTVHLIRIYPKYRKITHRLFIQEYVFK